jgi:hypothetical protein
MGAVRLATEQLPDMLDEVARSAADSLTAAGHRETAARLLLSVGHVELAVGWVG